MLSGADKVYTYYHVSSGQVLVPNKFCCQTWEESWISGFFWISELHTRVVGTHFETGDRNEWPEQALQYWRQKRWWSLHDNCRNRGPARWQRAALCHQGHQCVAPNPCSGHVRCNSFLYLHLSPFPSVPLFLLRWLCLRTILASRDNPWTFQYKIDPL